MLDSETKSRIDNCRNILVGKVPDPKSQVEQITIALIYKFMDDMDAESEELGGERKFFAGPFARFGWPQLMAPNLGGFEVLALYSEAISKMNENPGVPELFRDIFKNAYLPYRDPETLKSFLKEINTFTYDHSERLGDAFEYLLSVLGSQGDAGQFRTPRHIIDFMVEVMAPQKHETILDPACGTAGFLISAWKHILAANTSAENKINLTPDERSRLVRNIKGYDISPDMVRLSLVNLYLHGFPDPDVVEYDTLTQDDKWNELADVILANPPFMSPKGGIKPHKRFTVQASRSEVLFVDYMAEHLTATGRAAIVVPEGIIFQSGTAYKALRKMLVDTSLVAVVSLPAGVFNPYSGVKTSILILDKRAHKQTDKVLFVKVQNDGFNLGAQRRAVANSDLPEATRLLRGWLTAPDAFEGDGLMAQSVPRERIGVSGDFNLNSERYLIGFATLHDWQVVTLGDVCSKITDGSHNPPEKQDSGALMLSSQNIFDNKLNLDNPRFIRQVDFDRENKRTDVSSGDVLLTVVGTIGRCLVVNDQMPKFALQRSVAVLKPILDRLNPDYLCRIIQSDHIQSVLAATAKGVAQKGVYLNDLRTLQIPLPPLAIQKQIVTDIEGSQKALDEHRKAITELEQKIKLTVNKVWGAGE
jgi:type I restriction enzyme M protein